MTADELAELENIESRIAENYQKTVGFLRQAQSTFQLVGEDIHIIHEKFWKPYLKKKWGSWDRYIQEKFDVSPSHSYELLKRYKVLESVGGLGNRTDDKPTNYTQTFFELHDDTKITDELDLTGLSFRAVEALGRLDLILRRRVAQIVGRIVKQDRNLVSGGLIEDAANVVEMILDEMALEDADGETKPLATLVDARIVDEGYERIMRQREAETARKRETLFNLERTTQPQNFTEMPREEAQTGLVGLPIVCRRCGETVEIEAAFPGGVRLSCKDVWKIIAVKGGEQVVKFTGRSEDEN